MHQERDTVDVAVIGAGTVGLSAALALLVQGLSVAVIDPRPAASLQDSEYDGRDVALSNGILDWLDTLGALSGLTDGERSPIRGARVSDLEVSRSLSFGPVPGADRVGEFIPEHRLRDELFTLVTRQAGFQPLLERRLSGVRMLSDRVQLTLDDGRSLDARLLVAADGRVSKTRSLVNISHRTDDQGFDMLCCRVKHSEPHDGWTLQQFDNGGSIATLPLQGQQTSLALMLKPVDADRVMMMDEGTLRAYLDTRLQGRLGDIALTSSRYRVPLSGSYADRFHAERTILLGDAAVGMLPITAHGLNLGLMGARSLAAEVAVACQNGDDIGGDSVVATVARRAQLTARPLYLATQEIARLFTQRDAISRKLRYLAMTVSHPFQHFVGLNCEQRDARSVPWIGALKEALPLWKRSRPA
ncbi:FAD-dependent oxidoreductase [Zymobacter sp. IVIA_5232.4 C2]|uniref:FAD-dependent oxidoreductase n=1 Tax=Zymobacter sp. IVIA_5232.4 C2 TaxID=3394855 RepID=UPI0039C2AFD8